MNTHRRYALAQLLRLVRDVPGDTAECGVYRGAASYQIAQVADRTFAFVHIDVDLAQPTADSPAFFYPRMAPGGIIDLRVTMECVCRDDGSPQHMAYPCGKSHIPPSVSVPSWLSDGRRCSSTQQTVSYVSRHLLSSLHTHVRAAAAHDPRRCVDRRTLPGEGIGSYGLRSDARFGARGEAPSGVS